MNHSTRLPSGTSAVDERRSGSAPALTACFCGLSAHTQHGGRRVVLEGGDVPLVGVAGLRCRSHPRVRRLTLCLAESRSTSLIACSCSSCRRLANSQSIPIPLRSLSASSHARGWSFCRWFWDTRLLWEDCHRLPCDSSTPPLVRLLYCLEMGYYLQVSLAGRRLTGSGAFACFARQHQMSVSIPVVPHE